MSWHDFLSLLICFLFCHQELSFKAWFFVFCFYTCSACAGSEVLEKRWAWAQSHVDFWLTFFGLDFFWFLVCFSLFLVV